MTDKRKIFEWNSFMRICNEWKKKENLITGNQKCKIKFLNENKIID